MDEFSYMALGTAAILGVTALVSNIKVYRTVSDIAELYGEPATRKILFTTRLPAVVRPGAELALWVYGKQGL